MLILHRNQEALGTGAPRNKVTSSDWCCSDEADQSTSVRSKRASDQFLLASVSALHNLVYHDTIHGFSLVLIYDLLEHRCMIDDVTINNIFLLSSLNTNRFHVAKGLYNNRSQKMPKCAQNISVTPGCSMCATFFFLNNCEQSLVLCLATKQNYPLEA